MQQPYDWGGGTYILHVRLSVCLGCKHAPGSESNNIRSVFFLIVPDEIVFFSIRRTNCGLASEFNEVYVFI